MKEATGELNMTVITVVALAAVGALLYAFVWPLIKQRIVQQTCDMMGADYSANQAASAEACISAGCQAANADDADSSKKIWCCCPPGKNPASN